MKTARVFCVVFIIITSFDVFGKKFDSRCKLVRELVRSGYFKKYLGQWVCLIEKVSQRDTAAYREASGKKYYGLYQIKDVWCKNGKRGGKCNIACEALLDDDIRDDTECAVQIYEQEGFQYWTQWMKRCKNDNFITNEIYKCADLSLPYSSKYRNLEEILKYKKQHNHISTSHTDFRNYYGLNWFL